MLCNRCNKKEATFHISRVINGVKHEEHLCDDCAREDDALNLIQDMKLPSGFSFQNILSGFMDYMNSTTETNLPSEVICNKCGKTYTEFKNTGLLGCENCYKVFKTTIVPIIKRVQLSNNHIGKVPKRSGAEIVKVKQITELKEELQKAIAIEEYERAAEIRDKIRMLEKES